jgi:hypothetical protein
MTQSIMAKAASLAAGLAILALSAGPALAGTSASRQDAPKYPAPVIKQCEASNSSKKQIEQCEKVLAPSYEVQPLVQQ